MGVTIVDSVRSEEEKKWCVCVMLPVVTCVCVCLLAVDSELWGCVDLPPGLVLVEEFVSPEEEALLLDAIDWTSHDEDVTGEQSDLNHSFTDTTHGPCSDILNMCYSF